jgi:hypothetical protein
LNQRLGFFPKLQSELREHQPRFPVERLCEVFPFARAVVKRREFFGDEQAA